MTRLPGESRKTDLSLSLLSGHGYHPPNMQRWNKEAIAVVAAALVMTAKARGGSDVDWRELAKAGIEQHRMSAVTIHVRDWEGRPLKGVSMRVEQTGHAFMFGTCVHAGVLLEKNHERPRKELLALFNTVVFGNEMKWKYWENVERRQRLTEAIAWIRSNGLRLRGHTMLWPTALWGKPMPRDVMDAIEKNDPADRARVRQRTFDHVRRIGATYDGVVEEWDVINEQCEQNVWSRYLTPKTPVTGSRDVAKLFQVAREATPRARLIINDYHILVGDFPKQVKTYEKIIRKLLDAEVPLDGIGFQCHYHGGDLLLTAGELRSRLDRFAALVPSLVVTEYDTFGGRWPKDQAGREKQEAEFLEQFLLTFFSHPAAAGFMVWGFWDGHHWQKRAPFFRKDWTPKPALDVYRKYVLGEWMTRETLTTSEAGTASLRGFHGSYKITISHQGREFVMNEHLAPDVGRWDFSIRGEKKAK